MGSMKRGKLQLGLTDVSILCRTLRRPHFTLSGVSSAVKFSRNQPKAALWEGGLLALRRRFLGEGGDAFDSSPSRRVFTTW